MIWKVIRVISVLMLIGALIALTSGEATPLIGAVIFLGLLIFSNKKIKEQNKVELSTPLDIPRNSTTQAKKATMKDISRINDFKISKAFSSYNYHVAVDDSSKEIVIATPRMLYRYDYSKLIDFQYVEDGTEIVSGKSKAAAIGALAYGTTGAIIGSAGKRKQTKMIDRMDMNIQFNDLNAGRITVPVNGNGKVDRDSAQYKKAIKQAEELLGLLTYVKTNQ